ncbi:MAG: universal stress protein [Dehalococcoidia bacterium]
MKILIPLDGSEFAEQILEPAARFAQRCNAEVHLIEVVHGSPAATWSRYNTAEPHGMGGGLAVGLTSPSEAGVPAESGVQAVEREKQGAADYLSHVATRHFPGGAQHRVVTGDDPAAEIIKYVRAEGIDLIAIATHGRTGLARLMMGSVAGKLLKARVAPLMMVHPDGLD